MINNNTIIRFVNLHQNGDIFISSKFILDITKKLKDNLILYYIKLTGENAIVPGTFDFLEIPLLNIFDNVQYQTSSFITINDNNNEIIINTHCSYFKNIYGAGYSSVYLPYYYEEFNKLYTLLNIQLEPIDNYVPSFILPTYINTKDNLNYINTIYKNISKRKILICTGNPFSAYHKRLNNNTICDIITFFIINNFFVKVTHEQFIDDTDTLNLYKNQLLTNIPNINNISMSEHTTLEQNEIIAANSEFVLGTETGLFFNTMTSNTFHTTFLFITDVHYEIFNKFTVIDIDRNNIITELKSII